MIKENRIKDAVYGRRYIYNFHFQLIWVTKYRHQTFIEPKLENDMKEILLQVAKDNEIDIEKMTVSSDHVYLLISFPPRKAATDVIKAEELSSSYKSILRLGINPGVDTYGLLVTT